MKKVKLLLVLFLWNVTALYAEDVSDGICRRETVACRWHDSREFNDEIDDEIRELRDLGIPVWLGKFMVNIGFFCSIPCMIYDVCSKDC